MRTPFFVRCSRLGLEENRQRLEGAEGGALLPVASGAFVSAGGLLDDVAVDVESAVVVDAKPHQIENVVHPIVVPGFVAR